MVFGAMHRCIVPDYSAWLIHCWVSYCLCYFEVTDGLKSTDCCGLLRVTGLRTKEMPDSTLFKQLW
jgi:hypothetical protein